MDLVRRRARWPTAGDRARIGTDLMRIGAAAIATVLFVSSVQPVTAAVTHARWVTAWEAPVNTVFASSPGSGPSGTTVRNVARVWTAGAQIRVRVSNALDQTTPLVIGAATVGIVQNAPSPALATESLRAITFGGQRSVTLLAGTQSLLSDPVAIPVRAQEDIAISFFLPAAKEPGAATADYNTSYQAPPGAGDQTRDTSGLPFIIGSDATYALTGVDVLGTAAAGVIIGFGSSTSAPESTDFTRETERPALTQWLLTSAPCDGVVDWDSVLRSSVYPDTYNPLYYSDSIHPNALGHAAMAAAVPDSWFTRTLP